MDDHRYFSSDTNRRTETTSMEKEYVKPASHKRAVVLGIVNTAGMKSANVNRKRRWDQPPEELESSSKKVCVIETEPLLKNEIESPSSLSDTNIDNNSELSANSSSSVKLSDCYNENLTVKYNSLSDGKNPEPSATLKQLETDVTTLEAGISTVSRILTPERTVQTSSVVSEDSDAMLVDETININSSDLCKDSIDSDGNSGMVFSHVSTKTPNSVASKFETKETHTVETRTFVSSMSDSLKQIQFYDGGDSNTDSEDFDKLNEAHESRNSDTSHDVDMLSSKDRAVNKETTQSVNDNKICTSEEESKNQFSLNIKSVDESIDKNVNSIVNSNSVNISYSGNKSEVIQSEDESEVHSLLSKESSSERLLPVQNETEVSKSLEPRHCLNINLSDFTVSGNIHDGSLELIISKNICQNENKTDLSVTGVKNSPIIEEFEHKEDENRLSSEEKFFSDTLLPDVDSQKQNILQASLNPAETSSRNPPEELMATTSKLKKTDGSFYLLESSNHISNVDTLIEAKEINESKDDLFSSEIADKLVEKNKIEEEPDFKQLESSFSNSQSGVGNEDDTLKEKNVDTSNFKAENVVVVMDISEETGEASLMATNSKGLGDIEQHEFIDSAKISQEGKNKDIINNLKVTESCVESAKINPIIDESPTVGKVEVVSQNSMKPSLNSASHDVSLLDIPLPVTPCSSASSAQVSEGPESKISIQKSAVENVHNNPEVEDLKKLMEECSNTEPIVRKDLEGESRISEKLEDEKKVLDLEKSMDTSIISITESTVDLGEVSEKVETSIEVTSATNIDPVVMEVIFGPNDKASASDDNEVIPYNTLGSVDSDDEVVMEKQEAGSHHPDSGGLIKGEIVTDHGKSVLDSKRGEQSYSYNKHDRDIQIQNSEILLDSAEIVTVDPNKPLIEESVLISDTSNDSDTGRGDNNLMTEIDNYIDGSELDKTSPFDVKSYKISSDESNDGESKTTYETAKTISDDQDKDDSDNVDVKRDPSNNCELSKEETEETMESVYFDANQKDEVSESEDLLEGAETRCETITNLIETQKLQEEQNLEDFLDKEGANEKDMDQICAIRSSNLTEDYIKEGALKVQRELIDVCSKEDNQNKSLQIVSSVVEEMEINFEGDIPLESCDKGINQLEEEKEVAGKSVTNDIELNPENDRDSKETLNDEMKTLVHVEDSTNYLQEDGTPREIKDIDVSHKIKELDDEASAEVVNCLTDPNQSEATNVIKNLSHRSISISNEREDQFELLEQEKHEVGEQQIDDVQALGETKALQSKPKNKVDITQEIEDVKEVNESEEMEISLAVETIQRCEVIEITNEKEAVSLMPLTDELLVTGSTFPAVEKKEFVQKEDQEQEIISTIELECVEESQEETSKPVQETEDSLAVKSIIERSDEESTNDQMDVDDNLELETNALKLRREIDAAELDGYQQKMEDSLEMECTSLLGEVEYEIEKEFPKEKVQESLEKAEVSDIHKIECAVKDEDTSHSQYVEDIPEIVKMEESKTLDNSNKIKIPSESQLIENILSVKVTEQAPAENASNKCQVLKMSERKLKEVESDTIVQVTSELQEQESKLEVEQEKEVRFVTQTFPLNQEVEFLKKEDSKKQKDDILAVEDRCNTEKLIVPEKEGLEQKVFDILTMISNTEKSGTTDIQLSSKAETRTSDSQDIPISEKSIVIEPAVEIKNKKEVANQEASDSSSEQIQLLRVSNKLSAVRDQYVSEELSVPEVAEILEETAEQQKEISEPKTEDSNNKDNTPITPEEKMAMENSCHTFKKDDDFSKICAQSQDSQDVETELEAFTDNLQDNGNSRLVGKVIKEEFILEDPVTDEVKQLHHNISEEKEVLKEDDIKTSPKQTRTEDVNKVECLVVREEIIPSEHLTAKAFSAADCTHSVITKAINQTVEELPEEIIADDIIESIRVKDDSEVVIETEVMDSISGDFSNENQEVMEIDEPSDELKQSQGNEINTQMDDDDDSDRNLLSATPPPAVLDENSDSVQIVEDACTESKPKEKYQYYKEKSEEMSVDGQANTSSRVVCKENLENTVPKKDKLEGKGISLLSINIDQNVHNMDERLKSDSRDVAIVPLLTTITNENQQKSEEASKRVHLHSIALCSDEPQKQQPLSPLQKLEPITLRIYKDNLTIRTDGLDSPKKHRSPILSGELKTQLSPHLKGSPSRSSLSPQNKQLEFTLKIAKDANTNFPKATMSPKSNMSPSGSVWKTDVSSPAVSKESQSPSHGSPTSESTLNRLKLKICKPNESTEILTHSNVGFPSNSLETNPTIAVNCSDSSPSESARGVNTQCSQIEEFRTPKSHLKLETMFKKMLETQENIALSSSSINSTVQPDTGVAPSESAPQPPPPAPIIPTPRKRGRPRKIVPSIPRLPTDPNNPLHHSFTVPDSSSAMSADGGVNTNRPMRSCRGRTKPIVIATRKPRGGGMMRGGGRGRGILRITPDRETLTEYEKAELAKIEERKERLRAESIARYEAKKAKKLAKKLKDEERRKRLARERAEKAEAAAPQVFEEETRMSASDSSYSRGHTPATFRSNQALASLRKDGSKIEPREQALEAVAAWNANLNRERKEERRCALDLQTFTIHYPQSDRETMTRPVPKVGLYPIALIPGQFCDYYKQYTPTELMYFPLNTVLYGPLKPNERHQGNGSDDGSGSDSDTSSTDESSDSSTESSDTSDEQEEAKCKICKTIKRDSKDSHVETLIQCAQCKTTSHPSCQDFTDEMLPHIKKYDWVCTDCKQCLTCKTRGNVEKILCCDLCDRGHHVECLGLKKVPERWHCSVCSYCSNCGTRDPGGPDWQHEYKKDEKGMKVYQRTLCASCCNNLIRLFEYYIESSTRPTNKPV